MYVKIFNSIFDGSMRGHSDLILVFINLLCHADPDGIVEKHWKVIVDETGLSKSRVKSAIAQLEAPDKDSRSLNDDGRRIKRLEKDRDWGWEIINFKKYDGIRSAHDRREYMRKFMAIKRKENVSTLLAPVSSVLAPVSIVSPSDSDADTNTGKIAVTVKPSQPASRVKLVNEEWLKSLKDGCIAQGIDLDKELISMKRWLLMHPGRKMTQKFVVNWLNKCDKEVKYAPDGNPLTQRPLYPNEALKLLEELRSQKERIWNRWENGGKLPPDKKPEFDAIVGKIKKLEEELRK